MTAIAVAPAQVDTDRALLVRLSRWAHANGWERGLLPGMWNNTPATWADKSLPRIEVCWGPNNNEQLSVEIREDRYGPYLLDVDIPDLTSVRLAVDLLVAFGVLPEEFSSAYTAGLRAAEGGQL